MCAHSHICTYAHMHLDTRTVRTAQHLHDTHMKKSVQRKSGQDTARLTQLTRALPTLSEHYTTHYFLISRHTLFHFVPLFFWVSFIMYGSFFSGAAFVGFFFLRLTRHYTIFSTTRHLECSEGVSLSFPIFHYCFYFYFYFYRGLRGLRGRCRYTYSGGAIEGTDETSRRPTSNGGTRIGETRNGKGE